MNKCKARFVSIYLKELRLESIIRLECTKIKSHNKNCGLIHQSTKAILAHSLPLFFMDDLRCSFLTNKIQESRCLVILNSKSC